MSTTAAPAEHTFLVAVTITATDRRSAEDRLHQALPQAPSLATWWIAEDDRHDGSDCDSAVFVHPGQQPAAAALLHQHGLTNPCNVDPHAAMPDDRAEPLDTPCPSCGAINDLCPANAGYVSPAHRLCCACEHGDHHEH